MGTRIFHMLYVAAFTLLVAACATQSQKQVQIMRSQIDYFATESEKCNSPIEQTDIYRRANQIMILPVDDPDAFHKMTIDRFATQSEKDDLLQLHSMVSVCRKQNIENAGKIYPSLVGVVAHLYAENDAALARLMNDAITIGEANVLTNNARADFDTESYSAFRDINQELSSAHQSELQDRQRAAAFLQQWSFQQQLLMQNQQLINSVNKPTVTNCNYIGNTFSCRSH